jgi:hypothetical protein
VLEVSKLMFSNRSGFSMVAKHLSVRDGIWDDA